MRRRPRSQLSAIDQINMTPLLDLTFLLLIVFMISMPLMEYGTEVKTPEFNSSKLPEDNYKYINLKADGSIEMDKIQYTPETLAARLAELYRERPDMSINIRGDGSRTLGDAFELAKIVKRAGFTKFSLVTQAERK